MKKYFLLLVVLSFVNQAFTQSKTQVKWQQQVSYKIDVKLNDETHFLNGRVAIEYTNNSPNDLKFIYMHLWPNGYKNRNTAFAKQMQKHGDLDFYYSDDKDRGYIDSLSFEVNGVTAKAEATENIDVVKVNLPSVLNAGGKLVITTPFRVKIPKVFSRLGHKDQDYFITQWFPKPAVYDVNGWNPMPYLNLGEFYSEYGDFKVNIELPSNYTVVATGECQTEGELLGSKPGLGDTSVYSSNTLKEVTFTASNVHDFAWFASKRFGYVTKEIEVEGNPVIARIVAADPNEKDLQHIETAVTYYSNNVGPYPYSHATVVHGELKAGGGMEYPMITLCDFMSKEVIVHEVGHNWFYGILGNNERSYPWMDESINSFYEEKAINHKNINIKGSVNSSIMNYLVKDNLLVNAHQAINLHSVDYTKLNYGTSVYGVGAAAFKHLEAFLGKDLFEQCMKSYYEEWKFKHPLPDDMKISFEKISKKDLRWFFNDLLGADKKVDYALENKKGKYILSNKGELEVPMPVVFTGLDEISFTQWHTIPAYGQKEVKTENALVKVNLDPDNQTLDLFHNNNNPEQKLKLKFAIGRDLAKTKEVYWLPTYAWNAYDKSMLGLMFHNYSFSNKPFQFHINPLYSFNNNSINGIADFNYTKTMQGAGQYMEIGANASSFNFEERDLARSSYKYLKISPYLNYFLPKTNAASDVERSLQFKFTNVQLSPTFDFNDDTLSGPKTYRSNSRNFASARYKIENKRSINGYALEFMAEIGQVKNKVILGDLDDKRIRYVRIDTADLSKDTVYYFPNIGEEYEANNFARVSALFKYNVDMGLKDKPLELRVFGSYLIKAYPNSIYKNTVGSVDRAGYYDYAFDDVLMHRNADYGVFRNQISNRRDFSKLVGPVAETDKLLVNANITVPLPGKLPIKPYLELLTYTDIDKASFNASVSKFFYNVGLEIELIPNRLEVFVNLAQSKDVTDFQESSSATIDTFFERITFVLDLNGLTPPKIKKNLRLF